MSAASLEIVYRVVPLLGFNLTEADLSTQERFIRPNISVKQSVVAGIMDRNTQDIQTWMLFVNHEGSY